MRKRGAAGAAEQTKTPGTTGTTPLTGRVSSFQDPLCLVGSSAVLQSKAALGFAVPLQAYGLIHLLWLPH